jgi:hypothetical protein
MLVPLYGRRRNLEGMCNNLSPIIVDETAKKDRNRKGK